MEKIELSYVFLLFQTLSDHNRGNMSNYLHRIVEGFATLENISTAMMHIDNRAQEIDTISTSLRSPEALQETTTQISNTGTF